MSRGKERRRTSRPPNLHIWLRVATAPIGIAKSQIGLVRGPTLSPRRSHPESTETHFVEKYSSSLPHLPPSPLCPLAVRACVSRDFIQKLCDADCLTAIINQVASRCWALCPDWNFARNTHCFEISSKTNRDEIERCFYKWWHEIVAATKEKWRK